MSIVRSNDTGNKWLRIGRLELWACPWDGFSVIHCTMEGCAIVTLGFVGFTILRGLCALPDDQRASEMGQ